ncbi:hypothetical protein CsatA_025672 [Cannabis sativa]
MKSGSRQNDNTEVKNTFQVLEEEEEMGVIGKVDFVGLLETRVKAPKLGALYLNVFANWCFSSNIAWHGGGKIVIAWNPGRFNVDILKCTSQLMHLKLTTIEGFDSLVTVVYASNNRNERKVLWRDLCELKTNEHWLWMGDFNDIVAKDERIGQRVKTHPDTEFLQCVNECQVEDVKASGSFYTWSNKQHGDDRIYSKIDRIMANQTWINKYESAEAVFLNEGIFDHTPSLLTLYPNVISGKKPFKYFKMWKSHPRYESDLREIWRQSVNGSKMFQVVTKMKQFKVRLKEINKEGFMDLQTSVTRAKIDLDCIQNQLQKSPLDSNLHMLEKEARGKMIKVQGDYNSFLQQKSKVDWI